MRTKIRNAILSFPELFTATPFKPGDKPKFKTRFLVAKDDPQFATIKKDAVAALNGKFPGKGEAIWTQIQGNHNKCCIQDGDTLEYDGCSGHWVITANSSIRPQVRDRDGVTPITEADGRIYPGAVVHGLIDFFGYDNTGKGLSAALAGVQFVRDGEPLGGGRGADDSDFEPITDGNDTDDLI